MFDTDRPEYDFINQKNANDKVCFFENENHTIVITKDGAFIYTNPGQKHLKKYKAAVKFINNHIIATEDSKFISVSFEAGTIEYLVSIDDVEKYTNDLRVDRKIIQKYNRKRTVDDNHLKLKYYDFEHYSSKFESNYYTENGYCSRKEVKFTNSEYYNETIGTISTAIELRAIFGELSELSLINIYPTIEKLKEKHFEIFKDCFTDEYLETLA